MPIYLLIFKKLGTFSFPSAMITLNGCQFGFFRCSSHNEHSSEALSSTSSFLYLFWIALRNGLVSSSPILFKRMFPRDASSLIPCQWEKKWLNLEKQYQESFKNCKIFPEKTPTIKVMMTYKQRMSTQWQLCLVCIIKWSNEWWKAFRVLWVYLMNKLIKF